MQDFLADSLESIASLSIHWSSDCNMACKYCYIDKDKKAMATLNREIRTALEDGSFVEAIKKTMSSRRYELENISLWGAEPTLNAKFFKDFIYDLFDYFPNVTSVMFSTNALLGADVLYNNFVEPLYEYAENNRRPITFDLQLSLDGPPEFNDESRHPGATQNTIDTCLALLKKAPPTANFYKMKIFSKATLDISYMELMVERGIECFNWYYQFFNSVQEQAEEARGDKHYIHLGMNGTPTVVDPGYHTIDNGKTFAKWIAHLQYVDRTKLPTYRGSPLFYQLVSGFETFLQEQTNPIANQFNCYSCSASKNNITIDHKGNLYTCNRLCRNSALSDELKFKHAMRAGTNINVSDKTWLKRTWGSQLFHHDLMSRRYLFDQLAITMALSGQIMEKYAYDDEARTFLFCCLGGVMCHIGAEEDYTQNPHLLPASYFRFFGNGAVEEMIRYYNIEIARKEIRPWNIVM